MAYRQNFNPDALPAHVEPQQAAQMMGQRPPQASPGPPGPSGEPSWKNKPPPPIPGQSPAPPHSASPQLNPTPYGRASVPPSTSPVYGSYPPQHHQPGGYQQQQQAPGGYPPRQQPPGSYQQQQGGYPPQQQQQQQPPPQALQTGAAGYGRPYSNSLTQSTSPRPPAQSQASGASIPQAGSDPGMFTIFRSVDSQGSGQLTEDELGRALKNGDYTSFDIETVRMMIKMFDHDRSGTIGFEEFCGLWGFLGAWRQLFDRFDEDRSGYISYNEYTNALVAFGYHLTPSFISTMYSIYGRRRSSEMSFDLFVQSCISLKRMTDVFKRYDTDRDGFITLSFEEFLTEILNQR